MLLQAQRAEVDCGSLVDELQQLIRAKSDVAQQRADLDRCVCCSCFVVGSTSSLPAIHNVFSFIAWCNRPPLSLMAACCRSSSKRNVLVLIHPAVFACAVQGQCVAHGGAGAAVRAAARSVSRQDLCCCCRLLRQCLGSNQAVSASCIFAPLDTQATMRQRQRPSCALLRLTVSAVIVCPQCPLRASTCARQCPRCWQQQSVPRPWIPS